MCGKHWRVSVCVPNSSPKKWGTRPAPRKSPTITYLQPSPQCSLTRAPWRSWRKSKKNTLKWGCLCCCHRCCCWTGHCLVFTMETEAVRKESNNGGLFKSSLTQKEQFNQHLKEPRIYSHSSSLKGILIVWQGCCIQVTCCCISLNTSPVVPQIQGPLGAPQHREAAAAVHPQLRRAFC